MTSVLDSASLLEDLIALPGPPGQEDVVRTYVAARLDDLGLAHETDAAGNLLTSPGGKIPDSPQIIVTAHLDEIALIVTEVMMDGTLRVASLGGAFAWKWGEGPVEILTRDNYLPAVLGFGSIHTESPLATVTAVRSGHAPGWSDAKLFTGQSAKELQAQGVRPGSRVALSRDRRKIWKIGGDLISGYFFDDRADLVAWLLAVEMLRQAGNSTVLFAATASEEIGGLGAQYLLQQYRPEICIALEIGPHAPDAPVRLTDQPTVWVKDGYAPTSPADLDKIALAAETRKITPQWQALSRGGSDASCAAAHGLCARPITLAFPAENSHGFEIMHQSAPQRLAELLVAVLPGLAPIPGG